jgi:hypothetical protein
MPEKGQKGHKKGKVHGPAALHRVGMDLVRNKAKSLRCP